MVQGHILPGDHPCYASTGPPNWLREDGGQTFLGRRIRCSPGALPDTRLRSGAVARERYSRGMCAGVTNPSSTRLRRGQNADYGVAPMNSPNWFYNAARGRIAGHIGAEATAVWVRSRFLYAVAYVLAVPLGLTACLWAELSPLGVLWVVATLSWVGAAPLAAKSIVTATEANRIASAYLSSTRGYRMAVSCPITSWDWQWVRAIARADDEHAAHIRMAQTVGTDIAIEQLVERKRQAHRVTRVALGLIGFLGGFVVGVVLAFAVGQTESLGVFLVFTGASAAAFGLPYAFHTRFTRAVIAYKGDVTQELSTGKA